MTVYDDDEAESLKYKINQLSKVKGFFEGCRYEQIWHGGFEP